MILANGGTSTCSLDIDPDLFRAALVSLGSLGIIVRITLQASPQYNISYTTEIVSLSRFLSEYDAIHSKSDPVARQSHSVPTHDVVILVYAKMVLQPRTWQNDP
jgi:FAD/FMN-containing dehydrogenase